MHQAQQLVNFINVTIIHFILYKTLNNKNVDSLNLQRLYCWFKKIARIKRNKFWRNLPCYRVNYLIIQQRTNFFLCSLTKLSLGFKNL